MVLALTCLSASAAPESAWYTRVWQTDDGLPNNQVTSIAQGRDGYLWVGTVVGLARFDGFQFTPFPCDAGGNQDQSIVSLMSRSDGGLWVSPRRWDVTQISPDFSRVEPVSPGLPHNRIDRKSVV